MTPCLFLLAAALLAAERLAPATLTPFHAEPLRALVAGTQSGIDAEQAAAILREAGVTGRDGLADAARIHLWMEDHFTSFAAGGRFVGKSTAQGLLRSREFTGCHDWALLLAALLRAAGYPALLADAAGVGWMSDMRAGRPVRDFRGHVFVEAHMGGRWVLLNSTDRRYIPDYDPANPLIAMRVGDEERFCVMFKGLDPAGYGLASIPLGDYMVRFSESVDPRTLGEGNGGTLDLPRVGTELPALSDEALARPTAVDPSRSGVVVQFPQAGLDVHVERTARGYSAHLYRYGRVFAEPIRSVSFSRLSELRGYLRGLEAPE